jgi:outer membrane lipoprotein SlyB
MQKTGGMRTLRVVTMAVSVLVASCFATTTTSTTSGGPSPNVWVRPGRVEWIREVVQRREGNTVGGAVAGGLAGGLLGGALGRSSTTAVVGALGGAVAGAAISRGKAEKREYEVMVRYQDGGYQTFVYEDRSPFRPGQTVVLTPEGLEQI